MVPLIGYLDRFSARPGERIAVKVSSQFDPPYRADLVRIIHGDANPAGPGMKFEELPAPFAGEYNSRFQPVHSGSCGIVTAAAPIACPIRARSLCGCSPGCSTAAGKPCWRSRMGSTLSVAAEGAVLEAGGDADSAAGANADAALVRAADHRRRRAVAAAADRITAQLGRRQFRRGGDAGRRRRSPPMAFGAGFTPQLRAHDNPYRAFFNGRIEDPAIIPEAVDDRGADRAGALRMPGLVGFQPGDSERSHRRPRTHALHGQLVNLPTRAMRGSRWTGEETNWRHAPRQYAAIHFHEDDLYDCGWDTDFDCLDSGRHGERRLWRAAALRREQDIVPFYVLPPAGRTTAPIAFLASTFTYQIYGNHRRGNTDEAFHARQAEWGAYPWNADQHPEYGASTYNTHPDGSGICYSSMRRPLLTMRPGLHHL